MRRTVLNVFQISDSAAPSDAQHSNRRRELERDDRIPPCHPTGRGDHPSVQLVHGQVSHPHHLQHPHLPGGEPAQFQQRHLYYGPVRHRCGGGGWGWGSGQDARHCWGADGRRVETLVFILPFF